MTNFEKYHKESIEKGYTAVKNEKLTSCDDVMCNECDLNNEHEGCFITLLRWFAEEYKEPKPKLTEKEMHLCKAFGSGYIARDKSGSLLFYISKPEKSVVVWHLDEDVPATYLPQNSWFLFIKWEDEEPHSIEEMLTWEVEE